MKEFWTRWHIFISRWFGDYIFLKICINSIRKKRFKNRAIASHVAQMITMLAMGLWHGLTWYYISIWYISRGSTGSYRYISKKSKFYKKHKKEKWFECVQILTFHIACLILILSDIFWILFS